ncbi:hypothetical protein TBR22_A25010 [Luteitalea sp. TBR-22]|uniref:DinB family protein n=1 Tax=Luteitalea sp. TBR-22 TaxID=2802971 RepID=UPI001AF52877|nr:DinB family protein [Luteitalea sp. TBR-22]BCS33274.1 hypothetical protein TBR22_A25010 [Luteitalea sp. TBR-22]
MTIAELLVPEFDQEVARTRKMIALVPEDRFDFKPHEKSMTLGRLASHLAEMPHWLSTTLTTEVFEPGPDMKAFNASSLPAILAELDSRAASARALLATASDEDLAVTWTFRWNGHVVLSLPRHAVIRNMVLNHMVHHRAQLGVYLRLLDIPLPGTYGPSADETRGFA